ncbi:GTPase [Georgenia alba]|uniref:GTPase n=1 Tax=Georgenia alba TaxID=2233858 RepID=A0ABW2QB48_9MICO
MTTSAHVAPAAAPRHPRLAVVNDLAGTVEGVGLPLELPGTNDLRALRERVLTQIRMRLLPRLKEEEAPAVVVFGGSTGVGKSTLVNSLLQADVTEAGVLRPTTRTPVAAVHPEDVPLMTGRPVTEVADVATSEAVPTGLALLDAPDLNSVDARNRSLAGQLLEAADLWVFVTTASRYGDALPWRLLSEAHERGLTTAVVLNRVPGNVLAAVRRDLLQRLDSLGLGSAPLFVVPDAGPREARLEPASVAELAAWLRLVAGRHGAAGVVRRTDRGVWAGLRDQVLALADAADAQTEAAATLRELAERAADAPAAAVREAVTEGRAGSGAPTTRWLALASSGAPLAPLVRGRRIGRGFRGRALAARDAAAAGLADETAAALRLVIADALRRTSAGVRDAWSAAVDLGGPALLESTPTDGAEAAADVVAAWREAVRERVPDGGTALGRDGLAALVQTGAAGVAGAADAAERLAPGTVAPVREDLLARAEAAVRAAVTPYLEPLEALPVQPGTALRLRASELKEHA